MPNQYYESEQCFRRYESLLVQAVLSYPEEVRFEPTVRSINTDTARCRDALSSWRRYQWKASIDFATYKTRINQLSVWTQLGFICVGPRETWLQKKSLDRANRNKVEREEVIVGKSKGSDGIEEVEPVDVQTYELEQAIDMIEANQIQGPYFCENTEENVERVKKAIGDRINVVYVIDFDGRIRIF